MIASLMLIILELIALVSGVWFIYRWYEYDEIQLVPLATFVVLMLFVTFR